MAPGTRDMVQAGDVLQFEGPTHSADMLPLLLSLLWGGCLAEDPGFQVQVQEGLCIYVPCNISYPQEDWNDFTPAHGYWFRGEAKPGEDDPVATNNPGRKVQEETKNRFQLLGDPQTYNCSLYIRDAQRRDTGTYFFRVERGSYARYNYRQTQLSVHVTALTRTPDIYIQGILESGHPKNITYMVPWACERGVPPKFHWIGVNITDWGSSTFSSSVVTVTPRPQDHGSNLICRVILPGADVSTERTMQLGVSLTHTPNILIPGTLEAGLPSNLTCSVPWAYDWGTPHNFSWTSAAHNSLGRRTLLSSVITLTPQPPGPWHQPHLSSVFSYSWWDRGENHPAQCHLCSTEHDHQRLPRKQHRTNGRGGVGGHGGSSCQDPAPLPLPPRLHSEVL
ncbi:sialic acid-binding Ig-like lectin 13 [Rhynchonycteris naso]